MIRFFVILCLIGLTLAEICPSEDEVGDKNVRVEAALPDSVVPLKYEITLTPNIKDKKFTGKTLISVKIKTETNIIQLHSEGLSKVDDKQFTKLTCNGKVIEITEIKKNDDTRILTITTKDKVAVDQACILTFESFEGTFSEGSKDGFYLAKYKENEQEIVFATTQFEKFGARKAFPCFDEPRFKSTFIITLVRNKDLKQYSTISNEELLQTTVDKEISTDVYKETKLMPTYLVAFMVFKHVPTEVNQAQRVFADKPAIDNGDGQFALDMGAQILSAMENFTKFRYSFPKMDQVAIPDDWFGPGAMENWGLVTYRKSILVYPSLFQVTRGFQKTVSIIAHEFAHQWFGNLVTCESWKYLWLNEGFADYFEYFASAMIGWDVTNIFVMDSVHNALRADSAKDSRPMNDEAASSTIVYQKAGSVIRMMSHIVTQELFQESLSAYLYNNKYKTANPKVLYQTFDTVLGEENKKLLGGKTFVEIMGTWDSQAGYPVVTVNKTGASLEIKQERFLTEEVTEGNNQIWTIPLTYVFEGDAYDSFDNTTADKWMTEASMKIEPIREGWVIFNKQQSGYYRVKYDNSIWELLVNQLAQRDHTQIHPLNRAQLIDDAFTFAKIDKMNYTDVLKVLEYLPKEEEYVPIAVFLKAISEVDTKLTADNGRDDYKFYVKHLFSSSALNKINMTETDADSLETKYLRIELINWLCKFGHDQCTQNALDNLESDISNNLQQPIYCGAMRVAVQEKWDSLFSKLKDVANDLKRSRIINGLGCSENGDILAGYIQKILDSVNNINEIDGFRSIINAGDFGVEFMFNYTIKNFNETSTFTKSIINDLAPKLTTEDQKTRLTEFGNNNPKLKPDVEAATKKIDDNINWNKKYGNDIKSWFNQFRTNIQSSAIISKPNFNFLFGSVLLVILTTYFK